MFNVSYYFIIAYHSIIIIIVTLPDSYFTQKMCSFALEIARASVCSTDTCSKKYCNVEYVQML